MKGLKTIPRKLKKKQSRGRFKVPEVIKCRRVIRYWLEDLEEQTKIPLVINNEHYTRQSVIKKLGPDRCFASNRNLVMALHEYRLIRPQNQRSNLKSPGEPIQPLSLAQTISWAYDKRIQDVLLKESYLQSAEFKRLKPAKRVKILFNAYSGVKWFEIFRGRFEKYGHIDKIPHWHNIPLTNLSDMLCTADYEPGNPRHNLVRLVNKGLIIPVKGRFKRFSSKNFVHTEAFAQLVAELKNKDLDQVYVKDDNYLDQLVNSFVVNRLMRFLNKWSLKPDQVLTTDEAKKIIGVTRKSIQDKSKKNILKHSKRQGRRRYFKAIDFAIYALKRTDKLSFDIEDVSDLFGFTKLNPNRLGIKPTEYQTYARHHYVYPLYDAVSSEARKRIIGDNPKREEPASIPITYHGKNLYFTGRAQISYCNAYGVPEFDSICLDHVKSNLTGATATDSKLVGDEIIFYIKNRSINSVKINLKGALKSSEDSRPELIS